jgi:cyanophycinase
MSVHLVGGGRDIGACAHALTPFLAEARAAAAPGTPTIALLLVLESDDDTSVARFSALLRAAGDADLRVEAIVEGARFTASAVADCHGVFVGGGLTPAYHDAILPIAGALRALVARGLPYAGFSAGSAVAASVALVGGYRLDAVVVSPPDAAEELDGIEVRDGLALVPGSVDVHAAQWGTVSRLVAAVEAGLAPGGVAVDEDTAWIVGADGSESVRGAGRVWQVTRASDEVRVRTLRPAAARR